MGYTIRDYIADEIREQIIEVEQEYDIKIEVISEDYYEVLKIYKDKEYVNEIIINLNSKLSNTKDYLIADIQDYLKECMGCGKWFNDWVDNDVDLDITNDDYYHSLECLENNNPELWNDYCRVLGD